MEGREGEKGRGEGKGGEGAILKGKVRFTDKSLNR